MPALEPFGWQAQKRPRVSEVREDLEVAFRREEDLEEEVFEEAPAPSQLRAQLEDTAAKCRRLSKEGGLLAESERYAEALQRWEEALVFCEEVGERAAVLEQMAQVLLLLGRYFDAVRTADRAVEARPLWHCAHHTLGRALLNFGELERAIESLRRAAELEPADEEVSEELHDAERIWNQAQERASSTSGKEVLVNGRIVVPRFWETALRVTYDEHGRPTTHFLEEPSA